MIDRSVIADAIMEKIVSRLEAAPVPNDVEELKHTIVECITSGVDDFCGTLAAPGCGVVVPREPTDKMIAEGESAASFGIGKPHDGEAIPRVWRWMLAAAPQAVCDDSVLVPRTDLQRVIEIAGRNEASPSVDRLRNIVEAHKEAT